MEQFKAEEILQHNLPHIYIIYEVVKIFFLMNKHFLTMYLDTSSLFNEDFCSWMFEN